MPLSPMQPPFFVVGVGRSGTSLLRSFLVSHPDIGIPPETGFLPMLLRLRVLWWTPSGALRAPMFARLVFANGRLATAGYSREAFIASLAGQRFETRRDVISFLYEWLCRDQPWGIETAGDRVLIGDKTPSYSAKMEQIWREYPEAKFVVMVRNQASLSASLERMKWAPDKSSGTLAYRRHFERQPYRYRHDDRVHVVAYERLVDDPDTVLEGVLRFLGARPAKLDHREFAGAVAAGNVDPSIHSRLSGPLAARAAEHDVTVEGELDGGWSWSDGWTYSLFSLSQQKHRLKTLLAFAKCGRRG